ncbi:MAG: NUMOD3 domain-containing DNA-binding protein [Nanoarchaeota archaeon]|nr:NUMOD3 domain-containing DNA-binding protein [Nanoarchaeota archaeon]
MTCGIYKILNMKDGKVYVGKSKNIEMRWNQHKSKLKKGLNRPNNHLQSSWNKYGEENFQFEIIEECKMEELKEKEEFWINKLESWSKNKGYNVKRISDGIEFHSEESKRKMSESRRGENHHNFGKHLSKKTRDRISKSNKGKSPSERTREKMREKRAKQILSEEAKKKISESLRGDRCYNSKLTWEQVREIRRKYIPREYTIKMLSREYNVAEVTIQRIVKNETWRE